jgi:hypothetical protein
MVSTILLVAVAHADGALAVRVNVTVPAAISVALGVYTGCRMVASSKLPASAGRLELLHNKLGAFIAVELLNV